MGMWIHCWPFGCAFDPGFFTSWVAGALDSAWRAVDYYLALNHPKEVRDTFHDRWGSTEYWDDKEVDQTHDLTKKFLGIVAHQGGISSE